MIVLFGGTFDPVHYGHLRCAEEVREALGESDFRWLPAGTPPHRGGPVTAAGHRLEMLRRALAGDDGCTIDERELRRSGPSYMVDTLSEFRREYPARPLCLVIGEDGAATLDRWHRWRELFELAHLVIMRRPGHPVDRPGAVGETIRLRTVDAAAALHEAPAGRVWPTEVTPLDISSSRIRQLLRAGRSARFLAPRAVLEYAEARGLYGPARATPSA